ncbi:MAG: hypothetical protein C0513_06720 [Isosphaera sp.]|nr:hypothetical protein [Isosphaera sp.]
MEPPATVAALRAWVEERLGVRLGAEPLLEGHAAPLDYVSWAYFEGRVPAEGEGGPVVGADAGAGAGGAAVLGAGGTGAGAGGVGGVRLGRDAVVWASRGGGKTYLGAIATVLDMVFKRGVEVRILGGSLEQSRRMQEHLVEFFGRPGLRGLVSGRVTGRGVRLRNGSRCEVLAQSERSVRGSRVQKLRCDEVDLFEPGVWQAAQLTTRSLRRAGPWGEVVRGSVEALSTLHVPQGLMWRVVGEARAYRELRAETGPEAGAAAGRGRGRVLFRWGVLDVLERCPHERVCAECALEPECGGRAKERAEGEGGHVQVDDAVASRGRVSQGTWESEMLCLRPRRTDAVLPEFDERVHVVAHGAIVPEALGEGEGRGGGGGEAGGLGGEVGGGLQVVAPARGREWAVGMDFGYRSPTVALWAVIDRREGGAVVRVVRELVRSDTRLDDFIAQMRQVERELLGPGDVIGCVGVDPAGCQRSMHTGMSAVTVLRRAGYAVRFRREGVIEGVERVRRRLGGRGAVGGPSLLISERCARLIESMARYRYPSDKPEKLDPVKDGSDHAVDALRYMLAGLESPGGGGGAYA